jgi:hypothetical protein
MSEPSERSMEQARAALWQHNRPIIGNEDNIRILATHFDAARAAALEEAAALAQRTRTVAGREIANLVRALKTENIAKSEERTSAYQTGLSESD